MNKRELRAHMARHGDNNESLSKVLGISAVAFSKKINSVYDFRQTEIQKIIDRYGLNSEEVETIFFTPEVEFNET